MMGPGVTNYITSFAAAVGAGGAGERGGRMPLTGGDGARFVFFSLFVFCVCKLTRVETNGAQIHKTLHT